MPAAEQSGTSPAQTVAKAPPPLPPEVRFADANQAKSIVSSVHTQALAQRRIDADPPGSTGTGIDEYLPVRMRDGVMTATFEASNDQAARLLTHSLGQLKTALESQGVSVGRLHVEQAPKDSQTGSRFAGGRQEW